MSIGRPWPLNGTPANGEERNTGLFVVVTDAVSNVNVVRGIVDRNEEEFETMNFAFNEADTIVIGLDNVTIFKVEGENAETGDNLEEAIAR